MVYSYYNILMHAWYSSTLLLWSIVYHDSLFTVIIERGIPTRRAFFGEGKGPVHLSRAECTSEDTDLLSCTIDKSAVNGCDHSEDAGVICKGE